jgi:L,D-transpeptidase ErfK/SrfK
MLRSTAVDLAPTNTVEFSRALRFAPARLAGIRRVALVALAASFVVATRSPLAMVRATGTRSTVAGIVHSYVVPPGATITSVSARFGVAPSVIIADNGLASSGSLRAGQTLRLDSRHIVPTAAAANTVVINIPQRMLFYVEADVVTAIPVAVGRRTWATPIGSFTVVQKEIDPTWHVPASIRREARLAGRELPAEVPPGPNNPLGQFWLGLSGGGIGIHGTNAPSSIYRTVTHGCIRLHPDDIEWLFPRLPQGASVRTIYEPMLLTVENARVFLEVHPDTYRLATNTVAAARRLAQDAGVSDRVDWDVVKIVVNESVGAVRDVTQVTPSVSP